MKILNLKLKYWDFLKLNNSLLLKKSFQNFTKLIFF